MNKINKADVIPSSGLTFRNVRKDESDSTGNSTFVVLGEPQTNQDAKPISHALFLRERIETIQRIKEELGIQTQAAVEPMTMATAAIITYFISRHAHDLVKLLTEKVMGPLGPYWNDELISDDEIEKTRAIKRV